MSTQVATCMGNSPGADNIKITRRGKDVPVSSIQMDGLQLVVRGSWLRQCEIHDEEWLGSPIENPDELITKLRALKRADLFTFAQDIQDTKPKFSYYHEVDNAAVIPLTTFEEWWENRLPQESRKNTRRATKRGVTVREIEFNDQLILEVVDLFNRITIKQGLPFAHHGKDFATVKAELSGILDNTQFIGAYFEGMLIGYIKLVFTGKIARILNIISNDEHYDKRPMNILLSKAVSLCVERGCSALVYGKYVYGNKSNSALTEFKRRNGFEQVNFPRYYVPLTLRGRIAVSSGLHRGLVGMLPSPVLNALLRARAGITRMRMRAPTSTARD